MLRTLKILIGIIITETLIYLMAGISRYFLWIFWAMLPILIFFWIYFGLAEDNIFFTFVKEGTAKIIVKADEAKKVLIQYKGHRLDREWNVQKGEERHIFGGLRFYGFWPIYDVYIYNFTWTGIRENGEIVHHEKELIDYILLKDDVYYSKLEQAEDINKLPLDIEFLYTIRIVNPYKALFRVQNWLEVVIQRTNAQARDVITLKSYEKWISEPQAMSDELMKELEKRGIIKEFYERYGVDLRKIEVKSINPPSEYREATIKKYLAEREKERIETIAKAEKEKIEIIYNTIKNLGETGKLIRTLEAIEKSPLAASLSIQVIPGIQEILREIFGKERLSEEDIKILKEVAYRLKKEKKK